ncbi:MAG: alcohol dehydrogenase catalytic domain-containing protein [Nakamurella sp.]
MQAASYSAVSGPITIVDIPDPVCPPGGVVLNVRATGICRSDWHAWQGHEEVALPHIGGHEYAGEIAEVSPGMTIFAVGDRVTVPFVCGCGACDFCAAGDAQVCPNQHQPGFDLPGSFAEKVAVPSAEVNLVRLPDSVGFAEAAALGCRFATAFRAVVAHGGLNPGDAASRVGTPGGGTFGPTPAGSPVCTPVCTPGGTTGGGTTGGGATGGGATGGTETWVAVHGCGGVGLSAIMIAVALGARVVAIDVSDTALARAAALGAEYTLNTAVHKARGKSAPGITGSGKLALVREMSTPQGIGDAVRELTGGGCHLSIDALGSAATATASVYCLRRRGRHIQVGLLHGAAVHPPLPMDRVIGWELEILGSHGMSARDYPAMLDMVVSGQLRPADLVTRTIGLGGIGAALTAMSSPGSDGMTIAIP